MVKIILKIHASNELYLIINVLQRVPWHRPGQMIVNKIRGWTRPPYFTTDSTTCCLLALPPTDNTGNHNQGEP